jgi:hypothetical protein
MNILEKLTEIEKQIAEIKGMLLPPNTLKPYNRWYKSSKWKNLTVFFVDERVGYGFDHNGIWKDMCNGWFILKSHYWVPATNEEVDDILMREAVKRGFNKGTRYIDPYLKEERVLASNIVFRDNSLCEMGNFGAIFRRGEWAEIVKPKEEDIYIGGSKVEFGAYTTRVPFCTRLHRLILDKSFWEAAKVVALNMGGISIYGSNNMPDMVKVEKIDKILARLK